MNFQMHSLSIPGKASNIIVVEEIAHKNPYDFSVIHRHDYFEILLFENGDGGRQLIDFTEYKINSHDLFLIGPGQVHLLNRKPTENGILIQFSLDFMEMSLLPYRINWFFIFQSNPRIALDNTQFKKIQNHFKEIKNTFDTPCGYKNEKLHKLFAVLLFEILDILPKKIKIKKNDDLSYRFMVLVLDNFKKMRVVNSYAEILNVPINKLVKEVKLHFGKSPLKMINKMLLVEIKRLLMDGEISHKEIAYELNFDSQASFTRFVKTHTGKTPTGLKQFLLDSI